MGGRGGEGGGKEEGGGGGGVGGGGFFFFFFKQKTAYEMCGRDWSSDVCSSDLKTNTAISNYNQSHHLFINKPTSDLIFNYMQSDFVVDNLQIWDAKIEFLRACALLPPAPGMFKLRLHSWQSMRMTILCFNLFVFLLSLTDIDGLFHAY